MGQQQLHLIVLGLILVGIALVVGFESFNKKAIQSNRDAVILDLHNLSLIAQAHYKKTSTFGGGNNSYVGYEIPPDLTANENGTYTIIATQPQEVTIEGVGVEKEGELGCSQSTT